MLSRTRSAILTAGTAAFLFSQAAYAAPMASAALSDPLVSLSLLGSAASHDAVCAGSTAAIAGAVAAAQAAPVPGCVLPITAPPVAPPVAEAAPVMVPAASHGIGVLPLLLGLAAVAGVAALLLSDNGNGNGSVTPISPA